jgi:cation-transporting ATPase 13A3/4/5
VQVHAIHIATQTDWKFSIFGRNQVEIEEKSNLQLLIDEVLHPFFVFQIASIILWSLDDYYYYAACILIISVSSSFATFIETKKNVSRMQQLAKYSCSVTVWRNGHWSTLSSEDLVPGDVFQIKLGSDNIFPCDAVLLTGDCIVNESMLTGESLPVSKSPIPDTTLPTLDFEAEEPSSSPHMSKFFLFSGTKIIRVRGSKEKNSSLRHADKRLALALVVRTGFNTAKGSLVRSMLFPRPNTFKFYQDSFRFIGVLSLISVLGFLGSLYNFILLKINWEVIVIRALDLITIAVPPALPATMAIGTTFAISRLRKSNIFCTSPPRVNIGGKINMMCFDKTGTLTEEGLDVLGVRFTVSKETIAESPQMEVQPGPLRFSRIYTTIESLLPKPIAIDELRTHSPQTLKSLSGISLLQTQEPGDPNREEDFPYPLLVCAMACCHSIKVVSGELMGDPLDLKMFEFTKWHIDEDGTTTGLKGAHRLTTVMTVRPSWIPSPEMVHTGEAGQYEETYTELAVVKSFEFVSQLRRMSVILYRNRYNSSLQTQTIMEENEDPLNTKRDFEVFVKGAPEVMRAICDGSSCIKD